MTSVERTAELVARCEGWHAQDLLPVAERRLSSAHGRHQGALMCSAVEQPGVESIARVQPFAISVEPAEHQQIKGRRVDRAVAYLDPDRGDITPIYVKDPDGIKTELIAKLLLSMDGRGLGE
ncbi:MAG: hypothetical protein ACR2IK_09500 [Chloroflexota bacterium]